MSLLETIQADSIIALKEKKEKELRALRMLVAAIKNEEISKRPETLKEDDVISVVKREVKKLGDAVKDFIAGGREDLSEQYQEEAEILKKYLPEELGEDVIREIVKKKVVSSEDKNFGKIMKEVMVEIKGQADGGTISRIVKEELEK